MKPKITFVLFLVLFSKLIFSQSGLSAEQIYDACQSAIVAVYGYNEDGSFKGKASGVIVSGDGLLYTNFHVIDGADTIGVEINNEIIKQIPVIGFDDSRDAAILKLPGDNYDFVKICINDSLKIGQVVYALGNPNGLKKTFSNGILSRFEPNNGISYLQYSAPISPGSSGGALLNSNGELIGITSNSRLDGQNLNFAVPVYEFSDLFRIDYSDPCQVNLMKTLCCRCLETNSRYDLCADSVMNSFTKLIKNDKFAYEFFAKSYFRIGELDSALVYTNRTIELVSNDKQLFVFRGYLNQVLSNFADALNDYDKAIELDSNFVEGYFKRATYYSEIRYENQKALEDYTKVIKLEPSNDYAFVQRADCYLKLHDTVNALIDLANCLWDIDKNDGIFYKRGQIYYDLEMYDEAVNDYSNAISINKQIGGYYFSRAVAYSRLGLDYLAIRDYEEYMKLYPGTTDVYNNMGYCYMDDENYQQAEYFFLKSVKSNIHEFDSYIGLAILNFRQGKNKNSAMYMSKAIENECILEKGMNGLSKLEDMGYFWEKSEKEIMRKIFSLMGLNSENPEENVTEGKSVQLGRKAIEE